MEKVWDFAWSCVKYEFYSTVFLIIIAESLTLLYAGSLYYLTQVLYQEEEEEMSKSGKAIVVISFTLAIMLSLLLRNFYQYKGDRMALKIRKVLITALYDKITNLSLRSISFAITDRAINGQMLSLEN